MLTVLSSSCEDFKIRQSGRGMTLMIDILANLLNDYVDGNDDMTNLKFNEKKTMAVHPRLPVDSYPNSDD